MAIDPGSEKSAWVLYDCETNKPTQFGIEDNVTLGMNNYHPYDHMAIEMVACYGMSVGREVFETCVWIGRFLQIFGPGDYVYRKDVKICLCNSMKAKDSNIRQALIDVYGGKDKALGNKKNPGPLYGIKADMWSALAIAITWSRKSENCERKLL